jgi:hypothetical protein
LPDISFLPGIVRHAEIQMCNQGFQSRRKSTPCSWMFLIIDFSPRMGVGNCREGNPGQNLLLVYAIVHSNPFIASQSGFGDFWIQVGKAWKQDHK